MFQNSNTCCPVTGKSSSLSFQFRWDTYIVCLIGRTQSAIHSHCWPRSEDLQYGSQAVCYIVWNPCRIEFSIHSSKLRLPPLRLFNFMYKSVSRIISVFTCVSAGLTWCISPTPSCVCVCVCVCVCASLEGMSLEICFGQQGRWSQEEEEEERIMFTSFRAVKGAQTHTDMYKHTSSYHSFSHTHITALTCTTHTHIQPNTHTLFFTHLLPLWQTSHKNTHTHTHTQCWPCPLTFKHR